MLEPLIKKTTAILNDKGYRNKKNNIWVNHRSYIELRQGDLVEFYVGTEGIEQKAASFAPELDCDTCIGGKNVIEYILETVVLRAQEIELQYKKAV